MPTGTPSSWKTASRPMVIPLAFTCEIQLLAESHVRYPSGFNPAIWDTTKVWGARDFTAADTLLIRRAAAVAASARRQKPPVGCSPHSIFRVATLAQPLQVAPVDLWGPSACPNPLTKKQRKLFGLSPMLFKNANPCRNRRPGRSEKNRASPTAIRCYA